MNDRKVAIGEAIPVAAFYYREQQSKASKTRKKREYSLKTLTQITRSWLAIS